MTTDEFDDLMRQIHESYVKWYEMAATSRDKGVISLLRSQEEMIAIGRKRAKLWERMREAVTP